MSCILIGLYWLTMIHFNILEYEALTYTKLETLKFITLFKSQAQFVLNISQVDIIFCSFFAAIKQSFWNILSKRN